MKMSKKTRIVSIVMCIALMMGIMSASMMASASNSETPLVSWKGGGTYGLSGQASEGFEVKYKDGSILLDYSNSNDVGRSMIQLNTWGYGCYTADSMKAAKDTTGVAMAVDFISAAPETAGKTQPTKLDFLMRFNIKDPETNVKTLYEAKVIGIDIGKGQKMVVFPFSEFKNSADKTLSITGADLVNAANFEVDVVTWDSYWSAKITKLVAAFSPVYAYTDTADTITIPSFEEEPTTEEPTTEEPTTEEPTTEEPTTEEPTTEEPKTDAPTTQAPVTTVAPATTVAPTTVAPATQAPVVEEKEATPARVLGVKVKAGKKKVTVTWKKAKNAKTYVVKYSYKKNMKGAKVVNAKKAKVVIKKLKSGKKVYVQVQGVNGKAKGAFSKKIAKKVK